MSYNNSFKIAILILLCVSVSMAVPVSVQYFKAISVEQPILYKLSDNLDVFLFEFFSKFQDRQFENYGVYFKNFTLLNSSLDECIEHQCFSYISDFERCNKTWFDDVQSKDKYNILALSKSSVYYNYTSAFRAKSDCERKCLENFSNIIYNNFSEIDYSNNILKLPTIMSATSVNLLESVDSIHDRSPDSIDKHVNVALVNAFIMTIKTLQTAQIAYITKNHEDLCIEYHKNKTSLDSLEIQNVCIRGRISFFQNLSAYTRDNLTHAERIDLPVCNQYNLVDIVESWRKDSYQYPYDKSFGEINPVLELQRNMDARILETCNPKLKRNVNDLNIPCLESKSFGLTLISSELNLASAAVFTACAAQEAKSMRDELDSFKDCYLCKYELNETEKNACINACDVEM